MLEGMVRTIKIVPYIHKRCSRVHPKYIHLYLLPSPEHASGVLHALPRDSRDSYVPYRRDGLAPKLPRNLWTVILHIHPGVRGEGRYLPGADCADLDPGL